MTLAHRFSIAVGIAALFMSVSTAYANTSHNNDNEWNNYNYHSVDNSIHRSFNNYDSYNVNAYGYPYYNYSDNSYRYRDYNYDYLYKPSCSIWITGYGGSYGYDRTVQISWTSNYATSAYINNVGSVGVNGSQAIYYPFNDRYTMTVYGPGGQDTCTTNYARSYDHYRDYSYTTYPNYGYTTPVYVYPTVSLKQIPYTGFDYGPVGNSLYWVAMILVAVSGAYLIVYSHTRALPSEFALDVARAARNQVRTIRRILGS